MLIKRIIFDEEKTIKSGDRILCEIINDKGENEVKFISKTYLESMDAMVDSSSMSTGSISEKYDEEKENADYNSSSNCGHKWNKKGENKVKFISKTNLKSIDTMPGSSSMSTGNISETYDEEKENADYNSSSNCAHRWNENETKYLLDQYRMYFPQIGPYRVFRNKAAMFGQISKDLFQQYGIKITGQQCLNRFKNVNKQRNNALFRNKVSGNTPTEVPYEDEFEGIQSLDDSLKPEVLVGVNHIKINEKIKVGVGKKSIDSFDVSDTERDVSEKPRKRLKTNTLEHILQEISATAEENRNRRHKEKCDLLKSLLGKPAKGSGFE